MISLSYAQLTAINATLGPRMLLGPYHDLSGRVGRTAQELCTEPRTSSRGSSRSSTSTWPFHPGPFLRRMTLHRWSGCVGRVPEGHSRRGFELLPDVGRTQKPKRNVV